MKAPTRTPQEKCPSCGRQIFVDRLTGRFFAHCTEDPIETTQEGEFVGRRSPTWERENEDGSVTELTTGREKSNPHRVRLQREAKVRQVLESPQWQALELAA